MFVITTIRTHSLLRDVQYIFNVQNALEAGVQEEGWWKRATKYPFCDLLAVKAFIVVTWIHQGMRRVTEEMMLK